MLGMPESDTLCGEYFARWCAHVERQPEHVVVACSASGRFYRNHAARVFYGLTEPFTTREDAHQWIHPEDRSRVEDMASLAMKQGCSEGQCRVIIHGQTTPLAYRLTARACEECPLQCTVVIGYARPL